MKRIHIAATAAGSLGFPSKIPGTAYGLPASACITGAKLAGVAGSVCASCYAMKGNYGFKGNVRVRGHKGTAYGWVTISVNHDPAGWDNGRALRVMCVKAMRNADCCPGSYNGLEMHLDFRAFR